jgi:hypothetical protein
MDTFVTRNREVFEEEFHGEERLDLERQSDLIDEFKTAIREAIGITWIKMQFEKKGTSHPMPIDEIRQALEALADEIRILEGIKTLHDERKDLAAERRAIAKVAGEVNNKLRAV